MITGSTPSRRSRRRTLALLALAGAFAFATAAAAQTFSLDLGPNAGVTERALQLVALVTLLALAPTALVMATSFTRIVVVLSLLRSALGTQSAPPNAVMIALALFLTLFIMQPTLREAYDAGARPLIESQITLEQAFERASPPFKTFMLRHVRDKDLNLFLDLSRETRPAAIEDLKLAVIVPAFMISELRRAFEIGFLLFLPFLVIDLVVASILMSAGMMMVPPVTVALPFKLIFFVLVDGWNLLAGSLVKSYGG
jgi:flagellar biosynthetic protein FliP